MKCGESKYGEEGVGTGLSLFSNCMIMRVDEKLFLLRNLSFGL